MEKVVFLSRGDFGGHPLTLGRGSAERDSNEFWNSDMVSFRKGVLINFTYEPHTHDSPPLPPLIRCIPSLR